MDAMEWVYLAILFSLVVFLSVAKDLLVRQMRLEPFKRYFARKKRWPLVPRDQQENERNASEQDREQS